MKRDRQTAYHFFSFFKNEKIKKLNWTRNINVSYNTLEKNFQEKNSNIFLFTVDI